MAHTVEVVEVSELSDELVAYKCVCCGEAQTASWHTVSIHVDDHEESLKAHKDAMATRHEKKTAWRKKHLQK